MTISHFDEQPVRTTSPVSHERRRAAALLGLGALAAVAGGLSACGGRRRDLGTLGQPLPPDPRLVKRSPGTRPVWTPDPAPTTSPVEPAASSTIQVIDRSYWAKYGPNVRLANSMAGVARITVHHDGISTAPTGEWGDSVRRLESIRRSHVSKGWADIGYHFAVDPAGRVWACRPLGLQGAHVSKTNEHNIGIVVLGNFERITPSSSATASLDKLIGSLIRTHGIQERQVFTHQELRPTACPGRYLQAHMNSVRATSGVLAQA